MLPGGVVEVAYPLDDLADAVPDRLGLGRQVDVPVALDPAPDLVGHVLGGGLGVDDRRDRGGPAQVQVGVVLPGEPDAAVHLDVELRVLDGGRHGEGGGQGRGVAEPGRRRRPRRAASQTSAVASSASTSMFAQWCLTAWNIADRPAELLAHLGVVAGRDRAFPGHAGRLGGQDQPGQVGQHRPAAFDQLGRDRVQLDLRRPPGQVQVGRLLDGHAAVPAVDDGYVSADADQQQVGQVPAEHDPGRAARGTAVDGHVAGQRDRADDRTVGQAGQPLGLLVIGADRG